MHVFVAMPFGTKNGIDFDRVYLDLIRPALEEERFEVFRADEERRAGEIRTDMFQELLLADLVIADLSIDNANVWYELGVRHALRARGVVQVKSKREHMPFDVYTDRTLSYHLKDGAPDPEFLYQDRTALRIMCKETISSWYGIKISPVYHLLPYLEEPNWKKLTVGGAREFWEKLHEWESKINVARRKQRPGDILVLANEGPIQALRLEAYRTAGKALIDLGQFSFGLEQIEKALSIDPKDITSSQYKGILLGRLKKFESTKEWMRSLIKENPNNSETLALFGRVQKDSWIQSWRGMDNMKTIEQMRDDATYEDGLLREAIDPYYQAFVLDPNHYYSGINALTLLHLLAYLTGDIMQSEKIKALEGGIRWAIQSALYKEIKYTIKKPKYPDVCVSILAAIDNYIKERLDDQRSWYAQKAAFNKSRYRTFQFIAIIVTAIIPVINLTSGWSLDYGAQRAALLASSIISAGVAITVAISQMEKYFETWILYRTTAEALKREKFLFQNSYIQYSNLSEPDKNRLLVERVEAMTSSENSKFFAFQQQTRELQQQQSPTQQVQGTTTEQQK